MMRPAFAAGSRAAFPSSRALFVLLLLSLSAASFWLAGGHALAGRVADGDRLSIAGVETRIVEAGSRSILVVSGRVENRTTEARPLPPVLVQAGGEVLAARVRSAGDEIPAGAMLHFEARMIAPVEGERATVRVSFAATAPEIATR